MFEALLLGFIAQSSLLLSGLFVYKVHVPPKVIGILAGFGAGALIGAVAFDLVPQAERLANAQIAIWMLLGAGIFLAGDAIVDRMFAGKGGEGQAMGIVVGSVVDGVPESIIFGIQIAAGIPISPSFVGAVFISNIPQSLAPSADLAEAGWPMKRMGRLWLIVVVSCAIASALGYLLASAIPASQGDRAATLAAGGLIAMLTNSLMPFAFQRGASLAGVAATIGFCLSILAL